MARASYYGPITRSRAAAGFIQRYGPYINAAARGAMQGSRLGRVIRQFRQSSNNRVTSGGGITTQYDRKRVYRKRRMPRGKKRRWRRFVKKCQAAIDKQLASFSIVKNNQVDITATANTTNQAIGNFALYPLKDGTNAWLNDLSDIAAKLTTWAGTLLDSTKWNFRSAVLDLTIQNISLDDTDGNGYGVECDIYEISSRDSWESYGVTPKTLSAVLNDGWTNSGSINTTLALSQRGVTPWDATQALSAYKIRIWKKTKYFLGYGQTLTYQIRDPKSHTITQQRMEDGNSDNMPGMTRWLLVLAKPTPGVTVGTGGQTVLKAGVTRKYLLKRDDYSADQGGFF